MTRLLPALTLAARLRRTGSAAEHADEITRAVDVLMGGV